MNPNNPYNNPNYTNYSGNVPYGGNTGYPPQGTTVTGNIPASNVYTGPSSFLIIQHTQQQLLKELIKLIQLAIPKEKCINGIIHMD